MSGGHFEYAQFRVEQLADDIDRMISKCNKFLESPPDPDSWETCYNYKQETIDKFIKARDALKLAAKMAHRIDWLLSGDDSEKSFHERWNEEGL